MAGSTAVTKARRDEVDGLLAAIAQWAAARADVAAVALVGSWVHESATMESDVDVVLLTDDVSPYIQEDSWMTELGGEAVVRSQAWGAVFERRMRTPSGLSVEFGVGPPSWASVAPVDDGTRQVASDGLLALHDPRGLLGALTQEIGSTPKTAHLDSIR